MIASEATCKIVSGASVKTINSRGVASMLINNKYSISNYINKKKNIILFLLLIPFSLTVLANTVIVGDFKCLGNNQEIRFTNSNLYIGTAVFELQPRSNGRFYTYQDDVAVVWLIDKHTVQITIWDSEELMFNYQNKVDKYSEKVILACERLF